MTRVSGTERWGAESRQGVVGMIGGRAKARGNGLSPVSQSVGVISRSGGMASVAPVIISGKPACGFQPLCIIGGDAVIGIRFPMRR
jgi:succinyl-CoA synthetase alpha subunit